MVLPSTCEVSSPSSVYWCIFDRRMFLCCAHPASKSRTFSSDKKWHRKLKEISGSIVLSCRLRIVSVRYRFCFFTLCLGMVCFLPDISEYTASLSKYLCTVRSTRFDTSFLPRDFSSRRIWCGRMPCSLHSHVFILYCFAVATEIISLPFTLPFTMLRFISFKVASCHTKRFPFWSPIVVRPIFLKREATFFLGVSGSACEALSIKVRVWRTLITFTFSLFTSLRLSSSFSGAQAFSAFLIDFWWCVFSLPQNHQLALMEPDYYYYLERQQARSAELWDYRQWLLSL